MLGVDDYMSEAFSMCKKSADELSEYLSRPDACAIESYILYRKYMISYNSTVRMYKIYKEYKQIEERLEMMKI